nr:hypothetical protein [Tanacetum cinerariifolium]
MVLQEPKKNLFTSQDEQMKELEQEYILIPICTTSLSISQDAKDSVEDVGKKAPEVDANEVLDNDGKDNQVPRTEVEILLQQDKQTKHTNSSNDINNVSSPVNDTGIFVNAYDDDVLKEEFDINNVDSSYAIPEATKFLKYHPQEQVIGSLETPVETRHMSKTHEEFGLLSSVHKLMRTNHKHFQNCPFSCFLSQMEPKKPVQALQDPS